MNQHLFYFRFFLLFSLISLFHIETSIASRSDDEIARLRQASGIYVQQMSSRIRATGRLSAVFTRLSSALDRVTQARTAITESCRSVWNDQARLETCLTNQSRAIDRLAIEIRFTRDVIHWGQTEISEIVPLLNNDEEQRRVIIAKVSDQGALVDRVEQNILIPMRQRLSTGRAHYVETYGRQYAAPVEALAHRLDGMVDAYRFLNDLGTTRIAISENITLAIQQNRYLKAVAQQGALEWIFSQIDPMSRGAMPEQALRSIDIQNRLRTERTQFESAIAAARRQIAALDSRRTQMVQERLATVRSSVESASILRADRTRMIEILDTASRSWAQHRTQPDLEKLRIAEVLCERVSAWLEGAF